MELTKEQIEFLDKVCIRVGFVSPGECYLPCVLNSEGKVDVDGHVIFEDDFDIKEINVKFGKVTGTFSCVSANLTTLNNCPDYIGEQFYLSGNNLTNYFKTIEEEDFPHWRKLNWGAILQEYPFLINICKKYRKNLKDYLEKFPQTKLYLE